MKIRSKVRALDVTSAVNSTRGDPPESPAAVLATAQSFRTITSNEMFDTARRLKQMLPFRELLSVSETTRKFMDIMIPISPSDPSSEDRARDQVRDLTRNLSEKELDWVSHEFHLMEKIAMLRERIEGADADAQAARAHFDAILPEFQEKWREMVRRSTLVPLPPTTSTANNLEALMMANAYMIEPVTSFSKVPGDHQDAARAAALQMVEHLAQGMPSVQRIARKLNAALPGWTNDAIAASQVFVVAWMRSGFAKLEIGHKLAASLALTDVPDDIEVQAPWAAWSLVVPPDLFGDEGVARVWCEGTEVRFVVGHDGTVIGPITRDMMRRKTNQPVGHALALALDSLVRGCCLALSNPEDYKKHKAGAAASRPKHQRSGEPDFGQARFMLSAPITIDMRQHLLDILQGKKHGGGGSPTVQFLVRGHWRNQAHGPHRSLRKQIRIEAFWKGPEEARLLLRNYKVKEDE